MATGSTPRVLIIGGGFAGVGAAQKLEHADAEVVLVDRHDYHTFQPLLYQYATGLLDTTGVGHSLRDLLERHRNTTVHKAVVTAVDLDAREVRFDGLSPLSYDYLVFGLGAEVNYFGTTGAEEHAFPMYTLPQATQLKDHLLERWETADREPGLAEDGALNVVVVGGGPTGVETAGAIAELYRADFARDYPNVDQEQARVILVEAGAELFPMFQPNLRTYAAKALADRTVEVRTGTAVAAVGSNRVTLEVGGGAEGTHARLGRGPAGKPPRRHAPARARARQPDRGRRRPDASRAPRGLRRRRRRRDQRSENPAGAASARLGRAPVRRARRRDDRPPDRGPGWPPVRL